MKKLYKLNEQHQLISCDLVPDDYVAKSNQSETTAVMTDGLYEPQTFDFEKQKWSGLTYEEWLKNQPEPLPNNPSSTDKAIAQLTLQAAQQKVTQDKLNAQVLLEIAQLKGGNN